MHKTIKMMRILLIFIDKQRCLVIKIYNNDGYKKKLQFVVPFIKRNGIIIWEIRK